MSQKTIHPKRRFSLSYSLKFVCSHFIIPSCYTITILHFCSTTENYQLPLINFYSFPRVQQYFKCILFGSKPSLKQDKLNDCWPKLWILLWDIKKNTFGNYWIYSYGLFNYSWGLIQNLFLSCREIFFKKRCCNLKLLFLYFA